MFKILGWGLGGILALILSKYLANWGASWERVLVCFLLGLSLSLFGMVLGSYFDIN